MVNFTVGDIAIVLATLFGPVLAVQAQKWIEKASARKGRKDHIFRTLMATRAARVSPEHVQALNMIDFEYYGGNEKDKSVREAWNEYRDQLNTPHTNDEMLLLWSDRSDQLFIELLYRLSVSVGYRFERAHIKKSIYSPVAHGTLERDQQVIRTGLVALFSKQFAIPVLTMAATQQDADAENGTRPHRVEIVNDNRPKEELAIESSQKAFIRQIKIEVLRKIAGNRAAVSADPVPEHLPAFLEGLNEVLIVFADSTEVSNALVQYKGSLNTSNHNDRLTDLFKAICHDVGINVSALNDSVFLEPFTSPNKVQ